MKLRMRLLTLTLVCAVISLGLQYGEKEVDTVNAFAFAESESYIKYIDFTPSYEAMSDCLQADISLYGSDSHTPWTVLLALIAERNYGNFASYKTSELEAIQSSIASSGIEKTVKNQKLYNYYLEAFSAVLGGMVGEFTEVTTDGEHTEERQAYGLRVFSPIASGYSYTDYDDFGSSRSYGYKRSHLGHDLLGSVGTPIIAVESGTVVHLGWNRYGGWRVGIRSFDGKRYYYYAHLKKGHPYAKDLYDGKIVNAGEVIGYLGMTGYSSKEDVNGINTPHLHYGLQIIFHPSQIEGYNQIWCDMYALTRLLSQSRAKTYAKDGERYSKVYYIYPETPD